MYSRNFALIVLSLFSALSFSNESVRVPSMVNLIASPDSYSGSLVSVSGYLSSRPGFDLYLSKDHALMRDSASSISVENLDFRDSVLSEYCGGYYATVEGRVLKDAKRPSSEIYSFAIVDLSRVLILDDGNLRECWPDDE